MLDSYYETEGKTNASNSYPENTHVQEFHVCFQDKINESRYKNLQWL